MPKLYQVRKLQAPPEDKSVRRRLTFANEQIGAPGRLKQHPGSAVLRKVGRWRKRKEKCGLWRSTSARASLMHPGRSVVRETLIKAGIFWPTKRVPSGKRSERPSRSAARTAFKSPARTGCDLPARSWAKPHSDGTATSSIVMNLCYVHAPKPSEDTQASWRRLDPGSLFARNAPRKQTSFCTCKIRCSRISLTS